MSMNVIARNYKPSAAERKAGTYQGDPSIIFDTFVVLSRTEPVVVGWPEAELSTDDQSALSRLIANLATFGRAEGWVEAELSDEIADWNCVPITAGDGIPVFCPDPATAFDDEHYPKFDPRKPDKWLFDCPRWHICLDTQTVHENKWPSIPGGRWVNYSRPEPGSPPKRRLVSDALPRPTVARFLLDGAVLPLVTETLPVAEAFRSAAMSQFKRWCRKNPGRAAEFQRPDVPGMYASPILSGKDLAGVMHGDHGHAFYLPTAEGDDRRRITHITVVATDGFGPGEVAALNALRDLNLDEEGGALRVQLVGLGKPADFNHELFREATEWVSVTPFVGPAHIGRNGQERYLRKALRKEARRLVEKGSLPSEPTTIAVVPREECLIPAIDFRRQRDRRGDRSGHRAGAFLRLTFDRPVTGPVCLGYASHFGLGLFQPSG
jgi:CRISPR-associated protein Csb2